MGALVSTTPLQVLDPTTILELSRLVRALVAFAVVLVFGAAILWRYTELVDRAIDASIDRPLSSLGYGVAAHLTVAFFGAYTASQLVQVAGGSFASLGLWAGLVVLAVVGAIGFTVVGTAAVELRWERRRWHGLVLGAVLAGLVALADPLVAGLVWLVVVSTGVGGPIRRWFHAADDAESVG